MLSHDFLLLREGEVDYQDYMRLVRSESERVLIPDDALWYFGESWRWVPTLLPHKTLEPFQGLDPFGPTIIRQEGAALFGRTCSAWADLLACGPESLRLRGPWAKTSFAPNRSKTREMRLPPPIPEDNIAYLSAVGSEGYETIALARDLLVSSLRTLAEYGAKAATGEYFILHLGI